MRKVILLWLAVGAFFGSFAQTKAVTDKGDEVFLYDDGTWKFADESAGKDSVIPTNSGTFVKDKKSSFLLKSSIAPVGFWIDPKLWSFTKETNNDAAEYELKYKEGDLYAMIISEEIEIPLESLIDIALTNGKNVAPDLHIVQKEYRTVNGLKTLMLRMEGTMKGIKIAYFGYYYTGTDCTIQYLLYTVQNLLPKYMKVGEELLNGLVAVKD